MEKFYWPQCETFSQSDWYHMSHDVESIKILQGALRGAVAVTYFNTNSKTSETRQYFPARSASTKLSVRESIAWFKFPCNCRALLFWMKPCHAALPELGAFYQCCWTSMKWFNPTSMKLWLIAINRWKFCLGFIGGDFTNFTPRWYHSVSPMKLTMKVRF